MQSTFKVKGLFVLALTLILNFALLQTNTEAAAFKPNATVTKNVTTYTMPYNVKRGSSVQVQKNWLGFKTSMKKKGVKYYYCTFKSPFNSRYVKDWIPVTALRLW